MTYTNCDLILSVKDAEDHEKWLKTRDLGIGGSDAAGHPLLKKIGCCRQPPTTATYQNTQIYYTRWR